MLILRSAAATDTGPVRENNEDAAYGGRRLAAVADGIGGLPAGELASEIAIENLAPLESAPVNNPEAALIDAVQKANAEIGATGNDMGTTVTAVLLDAERGRLSLVHVATRGVTCSRRAPRASSASRGTTRSCRRWWTRAR